MKRHKSFLWITFALLFANVLLVIFILHFYTTSPAKAQEGPAFGPQQVITTTADEARSVFAADLDGDGDLDVLSASAADDKIAWYENTDGLGRRLGRFGVQQVITTTADRAQSVYAADLDGDGDMDVLSASQGDDKIAVSIII